MTLADFIKPNAFEVLCQECDSEMVDDETNDDNDSEEMSDEQVDMVTDVPIYDENWNKIKTNAQYDEQKLNNLGIERGAQMPNKILSDAN